MTPTAKEAETARIERARELGVLRTANGLLMASRGMMSDLAVAQRQCGAGLLMQEDAALGKWVKLAGRGAGKAAGGAGATLDEVILEAFRFRMLRRDLEGAAAILWPAHFFTAEPWAVRKTWTAMDEGSYVNVMGAGSVGKSFNCAARYFLEWVADPDWTRVDLVSKNQEKIKKLFADFVSMHRQSVVTLPGAVEAETIATDKLGGWGIFLNLIAKGEASSSVLKGTHEKSRAKKHPVFGFRTARYVLIDEAQDVNEAVYDDLGNVMLSMRSDDGQDCGGRRMRQITLTANPALPNSRYGGQCRPKGGWSAIGEDEEDWISEVGARCVRLDALKTENVREKRNVFSNPGLATWEGVQNQLAICGGNENHPLWFTYVRGIFPPEGALATLIPMRWLKSAEGEFIFENTPTEHCGVDVARLGGDSPAMAFLRVGRAVAWRDFSGHEYKMSEPGWRVQIDAVVRLAQGDTQEVADDVMRRLRDTGVRPENCAVDMTGSSGVFDLLVHQWKVRNLTPSAVGKGEPPTWHQWVELAERREVAGGSPVIGISYARKPTEMRVSMEDSLTARELYTNMASELCYALAKFFEQGYIRYGKGVSDRALLEISTRKGGFAQGKGKRMAVEPKEAHKKRLPDQDSPDCLDAITLALHSIRLGTPEILPKAVGTPEKTEPAGRPHLPDGVPFGIKDESNFGSETIESLMAAHDGKQSGQQAVFSEAGLNPADW